MWAASLVEADQTYRTSGRRAMSSVSFSDDGSDVRAHCVALRGGRVALRGVRVAFVLRIYTCSEDVTAKRAVWLLTGSDQDRKIQYRYSVFEEWYRIETIAMFCSAVDIHENIRSKFFFLC